MRLLPSRVRRAAALGAISLMLLSTATVGAWSDVSWPISDGLSSGQLHRDANGKFHIVYELNCEIHHRTNRSGAWVDTTIYPATGNVNCNALSDVAVTPAGGVHITFRRDDNNCLCWVYGTNESGVWRSRYAVASVHQGLNINPVQHIAVAHHNGTTRLMYSVTPDNAVPHGLYLRTYRHDGSSSVSKLPQRRYQYAPGGLDLAIDGSGKLHVVIDWYDPHGADGSGIDYLSNKTGPWTSSRIRSGGGYGWSFPQLALDGNRRVHAVFSRSTGCCITDVFYVTNATGSWIAKFISAATGPGSGGEWIAYSQGVHIAWNSTPLDYRASRFHYATNKGGTWSYQNWEYPEVDEEQIGAGAVDITAAGGRPFILYSWSENHPGYEHLIGLKMN